MACNLTNLTLALMNMSSNATESNDIVAGDGDRPRPKRPPDWHIPKDWFVGILSVDCILIIGGNLMVVLAVLRQPKLRKSPTNHLIISLAFSDLSVGLVFGPMQIVYTISRYVSLSSDLLCDVVVMLMYTGQNTTILTLVAIAADRYRAIVQPFKPKMTVKQSRIATVLVWVMAFAYSCYQIKLVGIFSRTFPNNTTISMCTTHRWLRLTLEKPMSLTNLVVAYIAPLAVVAYFYFRMIVALYFSKTLNDESKRRRRKAIKMLLLVVVLFALCWGPLRIHQVLLYYYPKRMRYPSLIFTVVIFLFFANSWVNPIIYAFFDARFRKEFARILTCGLYGKKKAAPKSTQVTVTDNLMSESAQCSTAGNMAAKRGKTSTPIAGEPQTVELGIRKSANCEGQKDDCNPHQDGVDNMGFDVERPESKRNVPGLTDSGVDLYMKEDAALDDVNTNPNPRETNSSTQTDPY